MMSFDNNEDKICSLLKDDVTGSHVRSHARSHDLRSRDPGVIAPRSRGNSPTFLKEDCLDENVLVTSLEPARKIHDSQVHQRYNFVPFGLKNEKAQYGKSQKSGEDGKDKRGRENEKGKKSERGQQRNKIGPVVEECNGS